MTAIRDGGRVYSFAGKEAGGCVDLGECAAVVAPKGLTELRGLPRLRHSGVSLSSIRQAQPLFRYV